MSLHGAVKRIRYSERSHPANAAAQQAKTARASAHTPIACNVPNAAMTPPQQRVHRALFTRQSPMFPKASTKGVISTLPAGGIGNSTARSAPTTHPTNTQTPLVARRFGISRKTPRRCNLVPLPPRDRPTRQRAVSVRARRQLRSGTPTLSLGAQNEGEAGWSSVPR